MSPTAPQDRKLGHLIKMRVAEDGLRGIDRVLFLNAEGEVVNSITSSSGPVDPDTTRALTEEMLGSGELAAVVHLFPAYNNLFQFGVVEVFNGPHATIHGLLSGDTHRWIPIADEVSDRWSRTWNRKRKE